MINQQALSAIMELGLQQALQRRQKRIEHLKEEILKLPDSIFKDGITFEIGCGKGHYLSAYGQAHKDEICVGIDLISSRIRDGERKNEKKGNENVFFLKADCSEFLEAMPEDVKLSKIFIFFPDPWPKKRHHRRRLIQSEFLTTLKKYSKIGTNLYFRTDDTDYFAWAMEIFEEQTDWQIQQDNTLPFEEISQFQRLLPVFSTLKAVLKA